MEKLRDAHRYAKVDRALRYLSIRLRSRPETAPLAVEVDAERARIRQAQDAWLDARELRVAASAELLYLDDRLDDEVMELVRAALVVVKGKRDDPRYRELFAGKVPSDALTPTGGSHQERFVRAILAQLTAEAGPLPMLREHAAPIEETLAALGAAERRRDDLFVPETTALASRDAALHRARRVYNHMHPRVGIAFPDDARLVESFFAQLRSTQERTEEDEGGEDKDG